ncbi:MAG: hypothetical protein DI537_05410 [Stutzerimonas stutzeri]|nr:MAG: hypothetical protein DI537_05410 [Stutzerimonas stutzeri]
MKHALLGYSIKREIQATTSAITGRKLAISFSGDGAWTNRTEMRLPTIHDAQLYPIEDVRVLRGYADHEAGHHRYTPFDVIDGLQERTLGIKLDDTEAAKAIDRRTRVRSTTAFNIWNAAEDWRIERNDMRDLPGTRKNLDATRNHVLRRERDIFEKTLSRMDDPYDMASAAFTWLNACENRYTAAPVASSLLAKLQAQNPFVHQLAVKNWPEVIKAGLLDDAAANERIYGVALEICDAIMDRYPPEPPSLPPPPGDGQGDSGSSPSPCDNSSGSGNEQGPSATSPGSASPTEEQSSSSDDTTGSAGSPASGASGNGDPSNSPSGTGAGGSDSEDAKGGADAREQAIRDAACSHNPEAKGALDISDVAKAIARVTGDMSDGGASASSHPLADGVLRRIHKPQGAGLIHYDSVRQDISGVTSTLTAAMRAIVIARDRRKFRPNREEGHLDMGNIAGLALRARDIFEQTSIARANNTSIDFLLDISMSMTSGIKLPDGQKPQRRIDLLLQSLISLTEALGPARNVRTRYLAYTGGAENVDIHLIKDWNQGLVDTKHCLDLLIEKLSRKLIDMNGTPTGQAMLDAWSDHRERRDNKKIQIILTDGDPDYNNIALAEQAADTIKRDGGSVIGIAIGGRKPKFVMENWLLVPDIASLPNAVLGSLRALLK